MTDAIAFFIFGLAGMAVGLIGAIAAIIIVKIDYNHGQKQYIAGYQDGIDKLVSKIVLDHVNIIHIEILKRIANELQEEVKSNGKN